MKIILSPAKEMNLQNPLQQDWQVSAATQQIVDILQGLDRFELQRILKVNDQLLLENEHYLQKFDIPVSYAALDLYHGLAYRSLQQVTDWHQHEAYANQHLQVLSALYGAVLPSQRIKPYRLDVTMPLKVQEQSLKALWKTELASAFEEGEVILNLASDEFSSLLDKKCYRWIDIEFYEKRNGSLKQHSTISKKARGKMAGWLIEHEVETVEVAKQFSIDDYRFHPELSAENKWIFIR